MLDNNLKEKLHHYIDIADEKKLAAIYTLVEEDIATDEEIAKAEDELFRQQDEDKSQDLV